MRVDLQQLAMPGHPGRAPHRIDFAVRPGAQVSHFVAERYRTKRGNIMLASFQIVEVYDEPIQTYHKGAYFMADAVARCRLIRWRWETTPSSDDEKSEPPQSQ